MTLTRPDEQKSFVEPHTTVHEAGIEIFQENPPTLPENSLGRKSEIFIQNRSFTATGCRIGNMYKKSKEVDGFLSAENVLKPHTCAVSCIASRNHRSNKLKKNYIATGTIKNLAMENLLFYCLPLLICYYKKGND